MGLQGLCETLASAKLSTSGARNLWMKKAEAEVIGEALAQGHGVTPRTDLRPSLHHPQALSSRCPGYMRLSFLGSQRIRASGVVLLEAILLDPTALLPCEFVAGA